MTDARRVEILRAALKVLYTWATFKEGQCLAPEHVKKLCRQTLQETDKDQHQK